MSSEVVVALIAAAASVVALAVNAVVILTGERRNAARERHSEEWRAGHDAKMAKLTAELSANERRADRTATLQEEVDRHRDPLLRAALDLAGRLENIQHERFAWYLRVDDERRRLIARASTYYRCARYWHIVNHLQSRAALTTLQKGGHGLLVGHLRRVGRTFASDVPPLGRSFMVWQEEQRAIAELMKTADSPDGHIGFATFLERLPIFEPWFSTFDALDTPEGSSHPRLARLQEDLVDLVADLDTGLRPAGPDGLHRERLEGLIR